VNKTPDPRKKRRLYPCLRLTRICHPGDKWFLKFFRMFDFHHWWLVLGEAQVIRIPFCRPFLGCYILLLVWETAKQIIKMLMKQVSSPLGPVEIFKKKIQWRVFFLIDGFDQTCCPCKGYLTRKATGLLEGSTGPLRIRLCYKLCLGSTRPVYRKWRRF